MSSEGLKGIEEIYSRYNGYDVAKAAKTRMRGEGIILDALTYGEIEPQAFVELLASLPLEVANAVFYDIGSGTGKAVLVAASVGFRRCVGLEIVRELHKTAAHALDALRATPWYQALSRPPDIELHLCDSFTRDWSDADVLFAPCTCFTEYNRYTGPLVDDADEMMDRLHMGLATLRSGAVVLATTRMLDTQKAGLQLLESQRRKYANGSVLFNVYKKI